jgi:hypothetical protein
MEWSDNFGAQGPKVRYKQASGSESHNKPKRRGKIYWASKKEWKVFQQYMNGCLRKQWDAFIS